MSTGIRDTVVPFAPRSAFATLVRHRWLLYVGVLAMMMAVATLDRPRGAAATQAGSAVSHDDRDALLLPTH